jgi:hypothetical protein
MALPVTIPNTFANATASIPLANLDANFVTIFNAVNGIGNGTEALANVNVTGGQYSNTVANHSNRELVTINANGAANTITFDVKTSQVLLYTGNATANVTLNIRGDGSTTLNNTISNNQSVTVAFAMTNNSSPFYITTTQVDGAGVTPKWQGGAPTGGTANSTEIYVYNVIKTGTDAYTVFASKTAFT